MPRVVSFARKLIDVEIGVVLGRTGIEFSAAPAMLMMWRGSIKVSHCLLSRKQERSSWAVGIKSLSRWRTGVSRAGRRT